MRFPIRGVSGRGSRRAAALALAGIAAAVLGVWSGFALSQGSGAALGQGGGGCGPVGGTEIETQGGTTVTIGSVELYVYFEDNSSPVGIVTVESVKDAPFSGQIFISSAGKTQAFDLDLNAGNGYTQSFGPISFNQQGQPQDISHVCINGSGDTTTTTTTDTTTTDTTTTTGTTTTTTGGGVGGATGGGGGRAGAGSTGGARDAGRLALTGLDAPLLALLGAGLAGGGFALRRRLGDAA